MSGQVAAGAESGADLADKRGPDTDGVVRRDVGKRGGRVASRVAGGNVARVEVGHAARQGDGRQGLASDFGQDVGDVDGRAAGTVS